MGSVRFTVDAVSEGFALKAQGENPPLRSSSAPNVTYLRNDRYLTRHSSDAKCALFLSTESDVRYWHIAEVRSFGRIRPLTGTKDIPVSPSSSPLLTRSGRWHQANTVAL
jgi:hypothetical protein